MIGYLKSRIVNKILYESGLRDIPFSKKGIGCNYPKNDYNYSYPNNISLGDNVHIGPGVFIDAAGIVMIGDGTIIAPDVKIYSRTHNFHHDLKAVPFDNVFITAPVCIGKYVWIGTSVIILPGVNVGDGAVVGAGSVVTKDVPSCAVIAGNPAKIVGERDRSVFEQLAVSDSNFVYTKFGDKKINKAKSDL